MESPHPLFLLCENPPYHPQILPKKKPAISTGTEDREDLEDFPAHAHAGAGFMARCFFPVRMRGIFIPIIPND